MSYAPGTGDGFVGSFDPSAERPECPASGWSPPLHAAVFCYRVGSTVMSWRCPECGNQFQGTANGLVLMQPWGSILSAFAPKGKSEAWE
jgi:hypothetical protein